ncbi:TetR/AcrR family transcriptional regulator [Nocardia sp. CA-135953]|uniref:TetR/AcrR family transcriptional regulator n=1 Tax=Nocardia sp. CA-135953 TaxID=3239978 RepID=UPI003D9621C9
MQRQRADARANRVQLLEAAARVFLENGISVPLDAVIDAAGVSRATFYRNFADRSALITALTDEALIGLETHAASQPDDASKVFRLFEYISKQLVQNPVLVDSWRFFGTGSPELRSFDRRFHAVFKEPISTAKDGETLRSDFSISDVSLVKDMLGTIIGQSSSDRRQVVANRIMNLIKDGISKVPAEIVEP